MRLEQNLPMLLKKNAEFKQLDGIIILSLLKFVHNALDGKNERFNKNPNLVGSVISIMFSIAHKNYGTKSFHTPIQWLWSINSCGALDESDEYLGKQKDFGYDGKQAITRREVLRILTDTAIAQYQYLKSTSKTMFTMIMLDKMRRQNKRDELRMIQHST